MRILHFIHALSGGGAEKQLLYLATASRQDDVHIAYVDDRGAAPDYPSWVTLHPLRTKGNYSPFLLLEMRRLISRVRPHVVQTWTLKFDVLAGVLQCFSNFVWVIRESGSLEAKRPDLKNRARLALASRASAIVSNSEGGDRYWAEHSMVRRRAVIHNGYDLARLANVKPRAREEQAAPYIVFIGRLIPSKNTSLLVRAMKDPALASSVRLYIIGDGPEKGAIEALRDSLGLQDRVRLTGYLPHEETLSCLASASALVLPSQFEGTPNVVLEAMALGVPVVISDCASHKSFFPDDVVRYFRLDVSFPDKELASVIGSTLEGLSQDKVPVARAFAHEWGMDEMARKYRDLYSLLQDASNA